MEERIPVYRCTVGDLDDTGIFAVSFVDCPAIERDFVALSKGKAVRLAVNKQKRLLTGALLVPDQKIYRYDESAGAYYITFSKEEIERIALKMMRTRLPLGETTHQHEKALKGNYLAELWTVRDPKKDKAVALGLGELPEGTLVVSYKVEDAAYWQQEVLSGHVKGFSLEGLFNFNQIKMNKQMKPAAEAAGTRPAAKRKRGALASFLQAMTAFLEGDTEEEAEAVADEAKKDETNSGTPYLIFELAEGGEIWMDADGFCTIEAGEQAPAGEHTLSDGSVIIIDDAGLFVETTPEGEGVEPSEADIAMAKQRGRAFLKAMSAKRGNASAEIAKLKARLAELEKQPSTPQAIPNVEGGTAIGRKDLEPFNNLLKYRQTNKR